MRPRLRALVVAWPRLSAALAFGVPTTVVTHFAWYPDARMNGLVPALTAAAGLAHALAGLLTGRRVVDVARTRTRGQALAMGAGTSLIAVAIFAPAMAAWVTAGGGSWPGVVGFGMLTAYTAFFSFLAAGWALLVVSALVALALNRIVVPPAAH